MATADYEATLWLNGDEGEVTVTVTGTAHVHGENVILEPYSWGGSRGSAWEYEAWAKTFSVEGGATIDRAGFTEIYGRDALHEIDDQIEGQMEQLWENAS